ncbi:CSEP0453 putative effector protein [Blumeria hordei DH14]|uniref:CSEP0453 putative effector protein n=1 Tax=Blumeria graminis f. sp. hordei (strain DH14) TaxID=546991 RepID=N1JJF3_BLUG1|nr:CSEP0453 putative effector protein [Blumeria hordei DH14]
MIRCAVAFLLAESLISDRPNRLVVTTDEVEKPSYGVYEVKDLDYFTNPKFIDASMFIKPSFAWHATYFMPYCSDHLDSNQIARKITKGLRDITHQAHVGLVRDAKMEINCLQSLSSISNLELGQSFINLSKCEKSVKTMCTSRTILNLAFKGIIAVDGPYKAFAPRMADQPIVVTQDQPIDMSSLVPNGEMLGEIRTDFEQNALAWYQGHLHLFKQNLETREWTPVTLIGSEMETGSLITNHILKAYPDFKLLWTEFYKEKEAITQEFKPSMYSSKSPYEYHYHQMYLFLNSLDRHDVELWYNYPFLDFECNPSPSDTHEYPRKSLKKNLRTIRVFLTWSQKVRYQQLTPLRVTGTTGPFEEKKTT